MGLHPLDLPLPLRLPHHALPLLLQRLQAPGTLNSRHVNPHVWSMCMSMASQLCTLALMCSIIALTSTPGNNPGLSVSDKNFKIPKMHWPIPCKYVDCWDARARGKPGRIIGGPDARLLTDNKHTNACSLYSVRVYGISCTIKAFLSCPSSSFQFHFLTYLHHRDCTLKVRVCWNLLRLRPSLMAWCMCVCVCTRFCVSALTCFLCKLH